jgi:hypothetical protein
LAQAPEAWSDSEKPLFDDAVIQSSNNNKNPMSLTIKVFIGSVIFCILALGIALYNFFGGTNFVSGDKVDIFVTGPTSITAGEPMSFNVVIKNNNTSDLQAADVLVEYPDGTRDATDLNKELKREPGLAGKEGTVSAGSLSEKNYKAVFFGAESEKKTVKVSVEYRVLGSNAVFHKEKDYDVLISSSPISMTVTGIDKINSGQALDFVVEVKSNSRQVIRGALVQAVFPSGFTFKSSAPSAFSRNVWSLGDLEVGAVRKIKISGVLNGQDGEERVFKFNVGLRNSVDETNIATNFMTINRSVFLEKSFLGLALTIDDNTNTDIVTRPRRALNASLTWHNNLPNKLSNVEIQVKFNGSILDRTSVTSFDGFYKSTDNTIIFSPETSDLLNNISPDGSGNTTFSFSLNQPSGVTNQEMTIDVSAKALRDDNNNVDRVNFTAVKRIKIGSNLQLAANVSHQEGPFLNIGPIPPKAEQETTYTINWTLSNSDSDVDNVTVQSELPSYVKWLGAISPQSEDVTYNQEGNKVVWTAGKVTAGTGKSTPPKTASFQVSFSPSLSQVGQTPVLLKESVIHGIDNFAGTQISYSIPAITTELTGDSKFITDSGRVNN